MAENKIGDLKKFFSTPEEPLSTADFLAEWNELSDEEKAWFKEQVLDQE